jgi:hypothetical protein
MARAYLSGALNSTSLYIPEKIFRDKRTSLFPGKWPTKLGVKTPAVLAYNEAKNSIEQK